MCIFGNRHSAVRRSRSLCSLLAPVPLVRCHARDGDECRRDCARSACERRVPDQVADGEVERGETDDEGRVDPLVAAGEARVGGDVGAAAVTLQHEIARHDLEDARNDEDQEEAEQSSHREDEVWERGNRAMRMMDVVKGYRGDGDRERKKERKKEKETERVH